MKLPNDQVGISDIIAWRDCPRRFDFSMDRWGPDGEHPESHSYPTAYGSAFHDAVEFLEANDAADMAGLQHAFNKWGSMLLPEDVENLAEDIKTYRQRDPGNMRLVGVEVSVRIPLLVHNGVQIYFRGKIDRLYESRAQPGHFQMRDYKTSRMPKSRAEVDLDIQQWAYNWAAHEMWPEIDVLDQVYDQLRFGELKISRKTDKDRAVIRAWIERQVVAMLEDDAVNPQEGRHLPRLNDWCGSCSFVADCPIIPRLTRYALTDVALKAPPGDEGNELRPNRAALAAYATDLPDVMNAAKALDNYVSKAKSLLLSAAPEERTAFGFKTQTRATSSWSSAAKQEALARAGADRFAQAVTLNEKAIKALGLAKDDEDYLLSLADKNAGAPFIVVDKKAMKARG